MTAEYYEAVRLDNMERLGFGPKAMSRIKVCAFCGTGADAEQTTCTSCGNPLPEDTVFRQYIKRHRICLQCETVLSSAMRYCPQCGMKAESVRKGRTVRTKDE